MRTVFLALTLYFMCLNSALAASPHNTYTHNATFAVPEQSYQLAATWFLPDWQAGMGARTDIAPAGSGDRHDLTCSVYGGCLGIPANMTCSDDFTVDGKTCYKSCSCKSGFVPVSSSDICKGCVNPCDARTAVDAPYGCEKYFSDCASKCEKAYPDNCRNQTAVPDLGFGCKTYFIDCPSRCQTAYTDNCHIRTAVSTPYGCEKYFDDCSSKCEKAYADNCRNYSSKPAASSCANGCAQGRTYADCSSKCSVGCKAKCDTGYHLSSDELSCVADSCPGGYEAGKTCGAGYKRLQSGQSGATPCYKCEVIPCTAGSTSCSGATVAKENGYYSGENKCYTCQTCEQAGKKTCNGSCIAASECCGGCSAGQECQNGTCVSTMSACEKYIRSVCTAANKCSVNGDTFSSAVEKIVLVDKDIDLGTLKFSAPASVTLSSAAEYASNADCTGKAKSKVTGTMPVISNSPAVNFNYLEMNSNTFETLASSFAFQNSDISSPIFRYKGEHTYSGPFSAMFYSTSTVTNTIAAPNGGYIQFQVDPEKKDAVALDAIVVTNAGGVIFGSTNPAIHPEVRNVNIEILQMTALDPDEYTSEARLMTGGLDVAINEVKIKDYSNTIIINTAADTTTNLGANLIISGLYLSNGVVNLSSQAATTAIPYIQLTNLSFLGYSVDCSDMLINNVVMKGSLFRGFNSNNSLSSLYLGNTEVPRGATCEITADGNYYDPNFQSACSWSY